MTRSHAPIGPYANRPFGPNWPKPGTSGVIVSDDGFRLQYQDMPISGALLNDGGFNLPEDNGERYWVRSCAAGWFVLGPVLSVVEGEST